MGSDDIETPAAFVQRLDRDIFDNGMVDAEVIERIAERDSAIRAAAIREFADHLNDEVFEHDEKFTLILGCAVQVLLGRELKGGSDGE